MNVVDSNGNALADGDSVLVIKDLKVKGSSMVIKRGTLVKKSGSPKTKRKWIAALTAPASF